MCQYKVVRLTKKQGNMTQRKEQNKFLESGPNDMGILTKNSKYPHKDAPQAQENMNNMRISTKRYKHKKETNTNFGVEE